MTVSELIKILQDFDGNLKVVMSRDPEGNGHMPVDYASKGNFQPGEFMDDPEDIESHGGVNAVCIWPGWRD